MKFRVVPRDERFFDLFEQIAEATVEGARLLLELMKDGLDRTVAHEEIRRLEHVGDDATRQIVRALDTTFVTPFDREDIHRLASVLDNVLDHIEAVADLLILHQIDRPLPEMARQAEVLLQASERVSATLVHLRDFRNSEENWREIHLLEDEGDRVYRQTVALLFSGEFGAMDVLRWKDLVDQLEAAVDDCEEVATIVESINLKHA